MDGRLHTFVAEDLWLFIAIVTVGIVGIAGAAGLNTVAGGLSILGLVILTPVFLFWGEEIAALLFREDESANSNANTDPLERLKQRYAEGEIDEAEFEDRLDGLLAADTADPEVERV